MKLAFQVIYDYCEEGIQLPVVMCTMFSGKGDSKSLCWIRLSFCFWYYASYLMRTLTMTKDIQRLVFRIYFQYVCMYKVHTCKLSSLYSVWKYTKKWSLKKLFCDLLEAQLMHFSQFAVFPDSLPSHMESSGMFPYLVNANYGVIVFRVNRTMQVFYCITQLIVIRYYQLCNICISFCIFSCQCNFAV